MPAVGRLTLWCGPSLSEHQHGGVGKNVIRVLLLQRWARGERAWAKREREGRIILKKKPQVQKAVNLFGRPRFGLQSGSTRGPLKGFPPPEICPSSESWPLLAELFAANYKVRRIIETLERVKSGWQVWPIRLEEGGGRRFSGDSDQ